MTPAPERGVSSGEDCCQGDGDALAAEAVCVTAIGKHSKSGSNIRAIKLDAVFGPQWTGVAHFPLKSRDGKIGYLTESFRRTPESSEVNIPVIGLCLDAGLRRHDGNCCSFLTGKRDERILIMIFTGHTASANNWAAGCARRAY